MFKNSCITVGAILAGFFAAPATAQGTPPASATRPASAVQANGPAPHASGTAPTAELKLKVATDHGRGTIATITDLAQQLKVEQLKRDVREAKKEQGGSEVAAKGGPGFGMPPPGVPVSMKAQPTDKQPPPVVAILGLGGRLRARLADGRDVLTGQEASGWKVKGITPSTVSFELCAAEKGRGKAETTCISKTVPPVPM